MGSIQLKELRESKSKSQQFVANKMGLSLTAYRNKEAGRSKIYVDELASFVRAIELDNEDEIRKLSNGIFFG